ncbi:hypothetical protein V8C86DRAFT_2796460 [Haematococcus lacustris]
MCLQRRVLVAPCICNASPMLASCCAPRIARTPSQDLSQLVLSRHVAPRCLAVSAMPAPALPPHASLEAVPGLLFSHATVALVLLYSSMLLAPHARLTRRLAQSPLVLAALAAAYCLSLAAALQSGLLPALQGLAASMLSSPALLPDPKALGDMFAQPAITCCAWLHLLMLDYVQARRVFLDCSARALPSALPLALCFVVGPLGLMAYVIMLSRRKVHLNPLRSR